MQHKNNIKVGLYNENSVTMNCGRSPNYNKDSLNMLFVAHFSQKNFIRRLSIDI